MILASLEVWHSRPFSPTRRVALGRMQLPVDPPPGFGGVLLAGIVAAHVDGLDPDLLPDLHRVIDDLDRGRRIVQPRLRHRFQTDRVGLSSSEHRLVGAGEAVTFEFGTKGSAAQQILGAVYATQALPPKSRHAIAPVLHRALSWSGPLGASFVAFITGRNMPLSMRALADPAAWARTTLGFALDEDPDRAEVMARFRQVLRTVHPDLGGEAGEAGQRIIDLTEARRILLGA